MITQRASRVSKDRGEDVDAVVGESGTNFLVFCDTRRRVLTRVDDGRCFGASSWAARGEKMKRRRGSSGSLFSRLDSRTNCTIPYVVQ